MTEVNEKFTTSHNALMKRHVLVMGRVFRHVQAVWSQWETLKYHKVSPEYSFFLLQSTKYI